MKSFGDRQSLRLKKFDYSQPGAYFVTVCTQERKCLFGDVVVGADPSVRPEMILNDAGKMIHTWIRKIAERYTHVEIDDYVVMQDHIHMIVMIKPFGQQRFTDQGRTHGCVPTLSRMIQWFKTMSTNEYIFGVREKGWLPFNDKLWQRGYNDHVIRDQEDLDRHREYIRNNPREWIDSHD